MEKKERAKTAVLLFLFGSFMMFVITLTAVNNNTFNGVMAKLLFFGELFIAVMSGIFYKILK